MDSSDSPSTLAMPPHHSSFCESLVSESTDSNSIEERLELRNFDEGGLSIAEEQKHVKRTHSKTEVISSLKCDIGSIDTMSLLRKKKKASVLVDYHFLRDGAPNGGINDLCKKRLNGSPLALVSMAFPDTSLKTGDRLLMRKALRRSSLVRTSPTPPTDGSVAEHVGDLSVFSGLPPAGVSRTESRRSRIAAVLEQAAAVGMAVEELTSSSNGTLAHGSSFEQSSSNVYSPTEDKQVTMQTTALAPSIRYRPQRRNSFVIHRKRPGSTVMTAFPPSCPVFPYQSEGDELQDIPVSSSLDNHTMDRYRQPKSALCFSSEGSLPVTEGTDDVNEPLVKDRWSATAVDSNDRNDSVPDHGAAELPKTVLLSILKTYGQSSNVPMLTKEAKAYYGYE